MWFSFDGKTYHSYDGSHLEKDSAIKFSKDLAIKIRNHFADHSQGEFCKGFKLNFLDFLPVFGLQFANVCWKNNK